MLSPTFWIIMAIFAGIFLAFYLVAQLLPDAQGSGATGRVLPILGSESDDAGHE